MFYNKNNGETKQRFGIRKLTIGTCSVLLSTLILSMSNNQTVHASEKDNEPTTEEVAVSNNDSQANEDENGKSSDANSQANEDKNGESSDANSQTNTEKGSSDESKEEDVTKDTDQQQADPEAASDSSDTENKENTETEAADKNTDQINPADLDKQAGDPSDSKTTKKNKIAAGTYKPVKGTDGKWQAPEGTPKGLELTKYVTATLKTNVPDSYRSQVPETQSFSKDFYRTATVDDNGKVTYSDWVLDGGLDAQGNATTWTFSETQTTNFYFPFDKSALPSAYGADNSYDWESSITNLTKTDNPNGGDHIQGFDGTKYGIRTLTVGQLPTDITVTVNWSNQQTYEYVNVDDNNTPVGDTATVSGLINSTGTVNLPALPNNYELVSGQDVTPGEANTVTITSAPTVQIKVQHKTKTYGITFDSNGVPSAQEGTPDDIANQMTKTTTIRINVSGAPESAGVNGDYTFTKRFYRTATTDLVTRKTTYGNWQLNGGLHADGSAVDVYTFTGADNFYFPTSVKNTNSLTPEEDSGYVYKISDKITPDGYQWPNGVTHSIGPYRDAQAYRIYHATVDQLPTSVITDIVWEKAYPVTINYVDGDTVVATDTVKGALDDKVKIPQTLPTEVTDKGYKLADGETIPETYTIQADNNTITVKLAHQTQEVTQKGTSTYVEHYHYWKDGKDAGEATADNEVQVGYKRSGIEDLVTKNITPTGDWTLDTSFGDNGYQTVSGTWTPDDGSVTVTPPTLDDYTAITTTQSGTNYTEFTVSAPTDGTTSTTSQTVYYVPNSDLSGTMTRTIKRVYNGQSSKIDQGIGWTRQGYITADDKGVVLGAVPAFQSDFQSGAWTSTSGPTFWNSTTVPMPSDKVVAVETTTYSDDGQIISGPTVLDNITSLTIPKSETLNPSTTKDETVTVTIYDKTMDIDLSGEYEDTYNGQSVAIPSDIATKVTSQITANSKEAVTQGWITEPDTSKVQLTTSDFSFADDQGNVIAAPTNAGTYHIILNSDGVAKFEKFDSSFNWNYNPTTAYATFTVNPATVSAALSGENSKTYDGQAVTTTEINSNYNTANGIKVTIAVPNTKDPITYQLQDGDYTWNTEDGKAPVNVGTYAINLNKDTIISHLQAAIDENSALKGNVTISANDLSSTATYAINPANVTVTLTGQGSEDYKRQPVTTDDLTNAGIKATYTFNGEEHTIILEDGYYKWYGGSAPENGSTIPYTLSLSQTGIQNALNKIYGTGQDNQNNVNVTVDGTASYTINPVEKTTTVSYVDATTDKVINSKELSGEVKDPTGTIVDVNAAEGVPTNWEIVPGQNIPDQINIRLDGFRGIYGDTYGDLNSYDNGITIYIQHKTVTYTTEDKDIPDNVDLTKDVTRTINITTPVVQTESGTDTGNVTYKTTTTTQTTKFTRQATYDLVDKKVTNYTDWTQSGENKWAAYSVPTVTGYTPVIKIDGVTATSIPAVDVTADTPDSTVDVTYAENIADVTISGGPFTKTYNGQPATIPDGITVNITIPKGSGITSLPETVEEARKSLGSSDSDYPDFVFVNEGETASLNTNPTDVGSYKIMLSDKAIEKLNDAAKQAGITIHFNYDNSSVDYDITPETINAAIIGTQRITYNGQEVTSVSPDDIYIGTNEPNITFADWKSGDYKFYQDGQEVKPINAGTYQVKLTQAGIDRIKELVSTNKNYTWSFDPDATATLIINQDATPKVTISGDATKTYDGTPIADYLPKVEISNAPDVNPVTLVPGKDYEFSKNGTDWTTTYPSDAGVYKVRLTEAGLAKITDQNTQNIDWSAVTNAITPPTGTYTITPANIALNLQNSGSKVYNGQPVVAALTTGDNGNVAISGKPEKGAAIDLSGLSADDFIWKDAEGNQVTNPTNVGKYTLTLTKQALTDLAKTNPNYAFTDSGSYTYEITPATATITLSNGQTMSWTGNQVAIDPSEYGLAISTDNGVDLGNLNISWDANDFEIDNSSTIPTAVGNYTVTLSQAGLDKLKNAINNSNYNVAQAGGGSYDITKAEATITLGGSASVVYTGNPAVVPVDADGNVEGITVTLSNGLTYNLKPEDLEFVEADHTNVTAADAPYHLVLSDSGLANISRVGGQENNYTYTYNDSQATLAVTPAQASYQLTGSQSEPYNGKAYTASDLVPSDYQIKITDRTGQALTYTLQAGDLAFAEGEDPTDFGTYKVVLTQAGIDNIKAVNSNYDYTALAPTATFNINAQEMHVNITGTASSVYEHNKESWDDGIAQGVPESQLSQIHLTWGGQNTKPEDVTGISLTTNDFVYYEKDANGNWQEITTNGGLPVDPGTYGLKLTEAAISRLNKQNPNYKFTNGDQISATFIINKRIATVTLSGSQSAAYTENGPLDLSNYTITVTDTTKPNEKPDQVTIDSKDERHLVDGDIKIDTDGVTLGSNGLPVNVGTYNVEMQQKLINRLKTLFPGYNFEGNENDPDSDGYVFAGQNNDASYIITPLEAYATLTGTQPIKYGESDTLVTGDFTLTLRDKNNKPVKNVNGSEASVTLTAGDLKIDTDATGNLPAGEYNVILTDSGIKKIKDIGYINVDTSNYSWTIGQSAKLDVESMPITVNLTGSGSSIFGNLIDLAAHIGGENGYSVTLTNSDGDPITTDYQLKAGDIEFVNGTPTGAGTFKVQLSQDGLDHIIAALNGDTNDYTLDKQTSGATYTVDKATPTVTVTGSDGQVYNGQAAAITPSKYTITISFNSELAPLTFDGSNLQFENADGTAMTSPTNVGEYKLGLTPAAIDHLETTYPDIDWDAAKLNEISTNYEITPAQATAVLSGNNSMTYDGSAVTTDDINSKNGTIQVTISVDGIDSPINYTLQNGDYTWNITGGQAPTNAGEYTLSLNTANIVKNLQAKINADSAWKGNVTINDKDLSGTADFTIDKANVAVTLSGTQTVTYNGQEQAITPGSFKVDLSTNNGQNLSYKLKDGDLQYATSGDHINVNKYAVELSEAGKKNIATDTTNYNYNFNGTGYVDVNKLVVPADAVTFANALGKADAEKTYDGQRISDYQPTINIVDNAAYGITKSAIKMGTGDYTFVKTNSDGTTTTYLTNPYSAGDYKVELTQAAIDWLKTINSENLDWSNIDLKAGQVIGNYNIKKAQATAQLSGEITLTYNGSQVSTHEINITDSSNPIRVRVTVALGNGKKLTPEYQLDDGDYVWTKPTDGVAPKNVGTYTIELNTAQASDKQTLLKAIEDQLNKIALPTSANGSQKAGIAGNYKLSIDPGSATIHIVKKTVTLTQDGSGTKVYDGDPVSEVPSLLSVGFVPGDTLNHNLPASDFDWYEGTTKLAGPPTDVGDYTAKLSQAGLDYLNETYPNYNFKIPTGEFKYSITQATAIATLNGSGSKIYNGQPVTTAEVNGKNGATSDIKVTVTINVPGTDNPQYYTLQDGDYSWNTSDGNAPTDAGNYSITLTDQGVQHIQNKYGNKNIKWSNEDGSTITGSATYEIKKGTGVVSFKADNHTKPFDNQNIDKDNIGTITATVNGKDITLSTDDYQIVDSQGNPVTDTKNAGTYYIALTRPALLSLEDNDNYTNWNVTFNGDKVTNQLATYTVDPLTLNAVLSGSNSKTYNGQAISTADINNGGNIRVKVSYNFTNHPNEETILSHKLTNEEYTISGTDPNDTAAGEYTIALNGDGAKNAMQAELNAEYGEGNVVINGTSSDATFTINPFEVTITTTGNAEVDPGTTTIPANTYGLSYGDKTMPTGWTAPTVSASDFDFTGNKPTADTVSGTYTVNYKGGQEALQNLLGSNYKVTYTPASDNYVVKAEGGTEAIEYIYNNEVVGSQVIKNKVNETVDVTPEVPINYQLAKDATVPAQVQIKNGTIQVQVTPKMEATIDTREDHRLIIIEEPDGTIKQEEQVATIERKVTKNLATGEVTYGDWSKASWDAYNDIPEITGYTASQTSVPAEEVTPKTRALKTITITYTANEQSVTIKFVDTQDDDKQVGTAITKSGKTGETITLGLTVPTNYKLAEGQTLPTSYKFTSAKDQVVVIKLVHEIDENYTDSKTITRTIVEKLPSGEKTIEQSATLTFTGTKDLVTGKTTGSWSTGIWNAFTPKEVESYTASPSSVSEQTVTDATQDVTIDITYTADEVPTPPASQEGTHTVIYVDPDGKEVKREVISGTEGATVLFTPSYPAGYKPVDGQAIPDSVVINGGTTTIVVTADEPIVPPVKPTENTHTIIYVDPNGKEIKKEVISGKDGTTVPFTPSYPEGYKPVSGQAIPDSITIDGGITRIVVVADKGATNTDEPIVPPVKPTKPDNGDNTEPTINGNSSQSGKTDQTSTEQTTMPEENEKTLPQTGEKKNTLLAAIGSLFAGLGLFGLAGDRRKKKNKD